MDHRKFLTRDNGENMALEKSKSTNFGVTANYWRIDSFYYSKEENNIAFLLGLHAASSNALKALESFHFNFSPTSEELSGNLLALCYQKAKTLNEFFADALDV